MAIGDIVAVLSEIMPGMGNAVFSLTSNPGGFFAISGDNLIEAISTPAGTYPITITAASPGGSPITQRFVLNYIPPAGTFRFAINLSGAENNFPAFPQLDEMTYLSNRVTKLFRIPLCWAKANWFFGTQGIQLAPFATLNPTYLASLLTVINNAVSLGAQIMPDIHMFGGGPGLAGTITVTSITAVGTLCTLSTPNTNGLVNGCTVDVEGAADSNYNGVQTVSDVTPTSFQYTATNAPSVSPAVPIQFANLVCLEVANVGSARLSIAAFVNLWTQFSTWLLANAPSGSIYAYDLMNEWAIPDQTVPFNANQAVTTGLRNAGDNTKLLYEGNNFSGAWNWTDSNDNFYQIVDPANNNADSPHSYADYNSSGTDFSYANNLATPGQAPAGLNTNSEILVQRMQRQVVPWAQTHNQILVVGEHAVSSDPLASGGNDNYPAWNAIEDNFLAFCQTNKITAFWWGNGPGFTATYPFNLSPTSVSNPNNKDYSGNGLQATQLVVIDKYTGYNGPQPTAYRNDLPTIVEASANPLAPDLLTVSLGLVGTLITNFLTRYNGLIPSGGFAITPHDVREDNAASAGGTLTSISILAGQNAIGNWSYTPAEIGYINLKTTNANGLTDPPAIQIVSKAVPTPSVLTPPPWTGVNLSGMEGGNQGTGAQCFPVGQGPITPFPAPFNVYGRTYPNYYSYRGMNIVRLPFKRERIQPRLLGSLDTGNTILFTAGGLGTYSGLEALDVSVNDAVQSGMTAMLDMHDFGGTRATIDISSVVVSGTTATCTVADTSIIISGVTLALAGTATNTGSPSGAVTIVNSTTFTIPVPNGTPSSGATTGAFSANLGTAGYTNAMFADAWVKIYQRYSTNPNIVIDLMNEPDFITAAVMGSAAQAAITALRNAGCIWYIMVEGGGSFSAGSAFVSSGASAAFAALTDPLNKLVAQVHVYLDSGGGGNSPFPAFTGIGAISLIACTAAARAIGAKLFLGEFGISTNAAMITETIAQLAYLAANADVWMGFTAWTTSPYVLLPPEVDTSPFQFPSPNLVGQNVIGGMVTDQVQMPALVAAGLSAFSASAPTGINWNWVPGFDAGFVPATTSIGTVLTNPLVCLDPNIDGSAGATFVLSSNPGGLLSLNGSNELVLAGTLTDFTTFPFSVTVTTAKGLTGTFSSSVICNSVTTLDPSACSTGLTLSNTNLTASYNATSTTAMVRATKPRSGGSPVYFEYTPNGVTGANPAVGLSTAQDAPQTPVAGGFSSIGFINIEALASGSVFAQNAVQATVAALGAFGNRCSVAWRPADKTIFFRVLNGNWNNNPSANPATNTGGISYASCVSSGQTYPADPGPWYPVYVSSHVSDTVTFGFASSSWTETVPSGFNAL